MASVVIYDDVVAQLKAETADAYWRENRPIIQTVMRLQAPIDTGQLRESHSLQQPVPIRGGFLLRMKITAEHAEVVHEGHGVIRPVKARALRWVSKSGQVVFARKVRPVAANPWTFRAWTEMGMRDVRLNP